MQSINQTGLRIALVGPGIIEIPPKGYGAIEIIIWEMKIALESLGCKVDIFNSKDIAEVVREISSKEYDFVHLHCCPYVKNFLELYDGPFCVTSHVATLPQPLRWDQSAIFRVDAMLRAPAMILLSKKIDEIFNRLNYRGFKAVLRNGVNVNKFTFQEKASIKAAVIVGAVDQTDRKGHFFLAKMIRKAPIFFLGPSSHDRFLQTAGPRYLGPWSRQEIQGQLTNYSTLVLLSDAEAAPLVVIEALAAGLSVIVTQQAAANLDVKPFIVVVPPREKLSSNYLEEVISRTIEENEKYRLDIRRYAFEKFDSSVVSKEYLQIIHQFNQTNRERPFVTFNPKFIPLLLLLAFKKAIRKIRGAIATFYCKFNS